MTEPRLPDSLVRGRHTPLFTSTNLPGPLEATHRTTVWAELVVERGSVRYVDHDDELARDLRVDAGQREVIPPDVAHRIEPSTDAEFFVQFYRDPGSQPATDARAPSPRAAGAWEHTGHDLDTADQIFEMVTRQYADVVQDDLLGPFFDLGGDGEAFEDWQALIGSVSDWWNHVLLYAPDYEIDVIEAHRPVHERMPMRPEHFERWLEIFLDTLHGGWTGPVATRAEKRATGMAWAMANRFLGRGVWRPPAHRGEA